MCAMARENHMLISEFIVDEGPDNLFNVFLVRFHTIKHA